MPGSKRSPRAAPQKTKAAARHPEQVASYKHPEATAVARPEIGAQPHFRRTRPPATYRYDTSLAPDLCWDGQNAARERGEALIRAIEEADTLEEARAAAAQLRAMSRPFLNWSGKAENLSFDVPTLPLFVHERLSTRAILQTLQAHRRDKQLDLLADLFGAPERDLSDQVFRAYEHPDQWVNRLILGDSLVVMSSLLRYEHLGGQAQMIYIDPPYGVKFGSNFQPFVRRRDVTHNDDDDFTREPEMVQAYRDTWKLGLHSYLTYLRDRFLLARELLHPSGSVFVQISDENLHHVREVMDEVFGGENCVATVTIRKTTSEGRRLLGATCDYLIWHGKDIQRTKYRPVFVARSDEADARYDQVLLPDGSTRAATPGERDGSVPLSEGARLFQLGDTTSSRPAGEGDLREFEFSGRIFSPGKGTFKSNLEGMRRLAGAGRLQVTSSGGLRYRRFKDDFGYGPAGNLWADISGAVQSRSDPKVYVVQTSTSVVQRCLLMTTDPGDLVVDPTCGSGTTAYVAEQWGRRWIAIDASRVPLALARQRLLTARFDYYELNEECRGPASGFVYRRRQSARGEETGGIVPHITLKSIANDEPPGEEVLVDRPERVSGITRVTGPFSFEATIPAAAGLDDEPEPPGVQAAAHQTYVERMIDVLRRAPVLRLPRNETLTLKQVRPPAKTLILSAEALIDAPTLANLADSAATQPTMLREVEPVAILFGPENGAISERLVREAWDEAGLKHYTRLLVIGFGIDPKAREFIGKAGRIGIPAVYLQASMDLQMGDLLKHMRSSQVFTVCGLPDVAVRAGQEADTWEVELLGLDTFDPATMEASHVKPGDVPAWFLDTDYNGLVFRVRQAFFPRTGAWESLKHALKGEFDESVWSHLAGTVSAPFVAGEHGQMAVKVIDPRGNELIVVRPLAAEP
ncbi:MAG: site-specific DNA-methyltransferase [Candidatus Latescibacterota bacterium]